MEQPQLRAVIDLAHAKTSDDAFPSLSLKIYGLTLLERTLRALERAGVSNVTLLAGDNKHAVEALINNAAPWNLEFTVSPHHRAEELIQNGEEGSCLFIREPVVLDPAIPRRLAEAAGENPGEVIGTPDGRLVLIPAGVLKNWQPGATLPLLPTRIIDMGAALYLLVRNREELRQVKKTLRQSLVKPTDGWVSRHLNRPISISISRVLAHTAITPNQFTLLTGLVGVVCGVFAAQGDYRGSLIAAALFHLASVLDGVDGELARLKFKSSPFGQWLDTVVDNSTYIFAFGGFLIGMFRTGMSAFEQIAGIIALATTLLALGSMYLYLRRYGKGGSLLNIEYSFQDGKTRFDRFIQVMAAFGRRDLFALIFLGLGIIGQVRLVLIYVGVLTAALFAFSIHAHYIASQRRKLETG